jgi:hypothetical protein
VRNEVLGELTRRIAIEVVRSDFLKVRSWKRGWGNFRNSLLMRLPSQYKMQKCTVVYSRNVDSYRIACEWKEEMW